MAWCKLCGHRIQWSKDKDKWVPLDADGEDHRDNCIPSKSYITKYNKLMKDKHREGSLQIGENEYI